MTINIVCTSKPCDGLLFYSYEYCSFLNTIGIDARLIIVGHRKFKNLDYLKSITSKYIHCKRIEFDDFTPAKNDITLIMGRSMMTLPFLDIGSYSFKQQQTLHSVFSNKVIAVYSENHPIRYQKALEYFNPVQVVDLCDKEVYPSGVGEHFEKKIFFDIYKEPKDNIEFDHLFLGTNRKYYQTVQKHIWLYPNHGILTYEDDFIDPELNNVFVPTDNLLGKFNTFVYTKSTFDPAPRIIQECHFFGKKLIYSRDPSLRDGGSVYWQRKLTPPKTSAIQHAIKKLKEKSWIESTFARLGGII